MDPDLAKLMVCHRAIQLATKVGVQKILESDSQNVVRNINGVTKDLPAHGTIVEEVKSLLQVLSILELCGATNDK